MLLDVNVLVALAWDSHVHHVAARRWFSDEAGGGWATCPVTESGFVRVSANPKVLPHPISVADARRVLTGLRRFGQHHFLADDVSQTDSDLPEIHGHRQVTDTHLVTLARRHDTALVTFDAPLARLAPGEVVLLTA